MNFETYRMHRSVSTIQEFYELHAQNLWTGYL
jgi:hypothetical protein